MSIIIKDSTAREDSGLASLLVHHGPGQCDLVTPVVALASWGKRAAGCSRMGQEGKW